MSTSPDGVATGVYHDVGRLCSEAYDERTGTTMPTYYLPCQSPDTSLLSRSKRSSQTEHLKQGGVKLPSVPGQRLLLVLWWTRLSPGFFLMVRHVRFMRWPLPSTCANRRIC